MVMFLEYEVGNEGGLKFLSEINRCNFLPNHLLQAGFRHPSKELLVIPPFLAFTRNRGQATRAGNPPIFSIHQK